MTDLDKAYNYILNEVNKDTSLRVYKNFQFDGVDINTNSGENAPIFNFTLYKMKDSICFSIRENLHLTEINKFENMPTYKFNIVDYFDEEEDGPVLKNALNKIKAIVSGLNTSAIKSITALEEKFLIQYDAEDSKDWI